MGSIHDVAWFCRGYKRLRKECTGGFGDEDTSGLSSVGRVRWI